LGHSGLRAGSNGVDRYAVLPEFDGADAEGRTAPLCFLTLMACRLMRGREGTLQVHLDCSTVFGSK
jgi:hypothetical protein